MSAPEPEPEPEQLQRRISASLLRIRLLAPFFAALGLFAWIESSETVPKVVTNGCDIHWNPEFLAALPQAELDGIMLHEILHAALLHVTRRGTRDFLLWNVAADIVVNGMIAAIPGVRLPSDAPRARELEGLCVEEVYERLQARVETGEALPACDDLLSLPAGITAVELEAAWRQAWVYVRHSQVGMNGAPKGLEHELNVLGFVGGEDEVSSGEPFVYPGVAETVPDLDSVVAGEGSETPFPRDPALRWVTTAGLTARATTPVLAHNALSWLVGRAPAEWACLFLTDTFRLVRERGQMKELSQLALQDPRFQKFLKEFAELVRQ